MGNFLRCINPIIELDVIYIPTPFSLMEALSDSLMPSIKVASSSVLRLRDLLRRFAAKFDSLASVSAV